MNINKENLIDRFYKFISFDTTSNPNSKTFPSTSTQLEFANILVEECISIGLSDVKKDSFGYVTASLPTNLNNLSVPTIGFLAHMDTSYEASGKNIKPNIIRNYDGKDIKLSESLVLSNEEFKQLNNYIGQDIITTDGNTLLGADNKAGISEILTALEYLINNPTIKHGTIKIAFTPDEEIGKGVNHFDVKKFGADFAYTIDGGEIGELQSENFNAASAKIKISGKSVHPGNAKDIMINASLVATEIVNMFPNNETPSSTEKYEGFYFLSSISGSVENAYLEYAIRDHDKNKFEDKKDFIKNVVNKMNETYPNCIDLEISDTYFNMKEIIENHPNIIELASEAMESVGVIPKIIPIRGGTDGSRLSFMGLPCPNIFSGGHNFHGPFEYIPIQSMIKACEVIVKICEINASK